MLLCSLDDIQPGVVLGAQLCDPKSPEHCLLKPGVTLDAKLLASLRARGVTQAWVIDDLTKDLDNAVSEELIGSRMQIYTKMRDDLAGLSTKTVSSASMQSYKAAILGLVTQAIASAKYASLTDALFGAEGLATHATNVAYLSILCAINAEAYVISEQPRLSHKDAKDASVIGLAGMLHDIGKARLAPGRAAQHEAHLQDEEKHTSSYYDHVLIGRALLEHANAPARVTNAVLNHHQRYTGNGWPDMTAMSGGRIKGALSGRNIHICARIVAAANVLDNLLREADGTKRPPVAALHAFASSRFDGWFDPKIRHTLLMRIPPFSVGTDVRLSDGRRAAVVAPSVGPQAQPCRPVVRILVDPAVRGDQEPESIDLSQSPELHITHAMGEDISAFLYSVGEPEKCSQPAKHERSVANVRYTAADLQDPQEEEAA